MLNVHACSGRQFGALHLGVAGLEMQMIAYAFAYDNRIDAK